MSVINGVSNIADRIAMIDSRLRSLSGAGATGGADATVVTVASVAFDPFGAAYQRALASGTSGASQSSSGWHSTVSGGSAASTVSGVESYATRVRDSSAQPSITPMTTGQVGGYGSIAVPAELAGYGNGEIPRDALEPIGQGGHRLWGPAANSWKAAVAAAAADGIDLRITDSYRTYDQQVDLAAEKGLYANGGLAAVPGHSNHGWGLAVDADVREPATMQWMVDNAHRFGYVQISAREPWHWEYRPTQA